jgi:hypothetical protein
MWAEVSASGAVEWCRLVGARLGRKLKGAKGERTKGKWTPKNGGQGGKKRRIVGKENSSKVQRCGNDVNIGRERYHRNGWK